MTHICVNNLTIIGPDTGLSPGRRQAIIWTNAGILLIGPWKTNCSEILISIHTFLFRKIHLKMSSAKCRPCCLGLNVLSLIKFQRDGCHCRLCIDINVFCTKAALYQAFPSIKTDMQCIFNKDWYHSLYYSKRYCVNVSFLCLCFFFWCILSKICIYYLLIRLSKRHWTVGIQW